MPKIQLLEQTTRASGNLGAGPVGGGELAEGIAAGGDAVNASNTRHAISSATEALSSFRLTREQKFLDAQGQASPDASGFHESVLDDFDTDAGEVTSALSKQPGGQRIAPQVRQQMLQMREHFGTRALAFEAQQRVDFSDNAIVQSAARGATVLESDPSQYDQVRGELLASVDAAGLPPALRAQRKTLIEQSLSLGAAHGVAAQDPRLALKRLADPNDTVFAGLTDRGRQVVKTAAENTLVGNSVNGILSAYQAGTDKGTAALGALSKSDLPSDLQVEVRSKVNEGVSQLRTQRRAENVNTLTRVEEDIAGDRAGRQTRQQVESLYQIGALSPIEFANYQAAITRSQQVGKTKQLDYTALQDAFSKGIPLDPSNADHRKTLDNYFTVATATEPAGSEGWLAQAQAVAGKTRILPDQASAWTRQAMRSPNAEVQARAAQFVGDVEATTPDALTSFDPQTKAFASVVNSMVAAGTEPVQAASAARTLVFDANQSVLDLRHKQFIQGKNALVKGLDSALSSYIDKDFDPGLFTSQPAATQQLSEDFKGQTEKYYRLSGDINAARDAAWKDLKRVYGPSSVNGTSTMMPFPPERFGATPEMVRADIAAGLGDKADANDLIIVPDALTLRQVSSSLDGKPVQPTYSIMHKDGSPIVDEHNVRLRYALPPPEELSAHLKAARGAAAAKDIEEAKAARTAELAGRETREYQVGF